MRHSPRSGRPLIVWDSAHVPVQGVNAFNTNINEGRPNGYPSQRAVMSPGDRVEGVITRVEPYGLYLTHDGEVVLVLAPDVSLQRPLDLPSTYAAGDRLMVRILRYISEQSIYKAQRRKASKGGRLASRRATDEPW